MFRTDGIWEHEGHLQEAKNRKAQLLRDIAVEDRIIARHERVLKYLNSLTEERLEEGHPYFRKDFTQEGSENV